MASTTLRGLLTEKKPSIPIIMAAAQNNNNNNINPNWPVMKPSNVSLWSDFTLASINGSFSDILDAPMLPDKAQFAAVDQAFRELHGFQIQWPLQVRKLLVFTDRLLMLTLTETKNKLNLCPGIHLRSQCMVPENNVIHLRRDATVGTTDYCLQLDGVDGILAVGFARPSSRWTSGQALNAQGNAPIHLVCQLANSCAAAGTRYGFILTEKELAVCQFDKGARNSSTTSSTNNPFAALVGGNPFSTSTALAAPTAAEPEWQVAIMPVPWMNHGSQVLTTDLAMWWLCMKAMADYEQRTFSSNIQARLRGIQGPASSAGSGFESTAGWL